MEPIILEEEKATVQNEYVKHLSEEGYCVVPGVFTPEKCEEVIDKLWEWLR
jgi:hypothetical protein